MSLVSTKLTKKHEMQVESIATEFTKNCSQFEKLNAVTVSHRLFTVHPHHTRQEMTVKFATNHILGIVSRCYAERDQAKRLVLFKAISGHPWFAAAAGRIFELQAFLWFRHSPHQDSLPCTPADLNITPLAIPVCGSNMKFFAKVDELKKVDKDERLKCLIPVAQNFPTMDAIFLPEKFIITVQMTVSSNHDAKSIGFEKVYQKFHADVRATRQWCHVFLTDSEDKAAILRKQTLTELLKKCKIAVYSAVMDIAERDSVLTPQRVKELDGYWLHVIDADVY